MFALFVPCMKVVICRYMYGILMSGMNISLYQVYNDLFLCNVCNVCMLGKAGCFLYVKYSWLVTVCYRYFSIQMFPILPISHCYIPALVLTFNILIWSQSCLLCTDCGVFMFTVNDEAGLNFITLSHDVCISKWSENLTYKNVW